MANNVQQARAITLCLQKTFLPFNDFENELEVLTKNILSNSESIMKDMISSAEEFKMHIKMKEKNGRNRKKKEEVLQRPDIILEENEDMDDIQVTECHVALKDCTNVPTIKVENEEEPQQLRDTTVSSTTGRPVRAATGVAYEKMNYQKEMSYKTKLRRPSDFNQNDCVVYNVYNQTNKLDHTSNDVAPRTKRRKGSNNTTVTSSHFFGAVVHSSSPIQKLINQCDAPKGLELSMIPTVNANTEMTYIMDTHCRVEPRKEEIKTTSSVEGTEISTTVSKHTTLIMEVEEECTVRTRTRQAKRQLDETLTKKAINNETIVLPTKPVAKENNTTSKSNHENTDDDSNDTLVNTKKEKKPGRKKAKADESKPDTSDSEGEGYRTRTKVTKKPVNKVEDLPVITDSPTTRTIGENIKEKLNVFENHGDQIEEGRVTRTKAKNVNKSEEGKTNPDDPFKVPAAIKPLKDMKKGIVKKVEKPKELNVDPKQMTMDEKKRLREERAQRAAAAREQAEKERIEHALRLEKEKEEKLKLKKQRDEKLKEEQEKKRLLAVQKKQAEIDAQKRENEAARMAKLQEMMEQEERKAAQRKKEIEAHERKIQQAKLAEKLKANQTKVAPKKDISESKPHQEQNYFISEDPPPSDDEEEVDPKRPIPSWASSAIRTPELKLQSYLFDHLIRFFQNPLDFHPSEIELFGKDKIKLRPRTSSAVWDATMRDESLTHF